MASEANASITREASVDITSTVRRTKAGDRGYGRGWAERVSSEHDDKNEDEGGDDNQCNETTTSEGEYDTATRTTTMAREQQPK